MSSGSGGQKFVRQVNDSIYEVLDKLGVEDGRFWCECTDPYCREQVLLTLREYAALRHREGQFLSARDHDMTMRPV